MYASMHSLYEDIIPMSWGGEMGRKQVFFSEQKI